MHLVFWQPIPSFHQEAFLTALARADWVDSVTLRVESDLPPSFREEGWPVPQFEGVTVEPIRLDRPPEDRTAYCHIFTGFYTHKKIWKAFDWLDEPRKCRCLAYAECPALFEWRGPLRRLKYRFNAGLLARSLDGILAVGQRGVDFYEPILHGRLPVHRFGYFDLAESDFPRLVTATPHTRVELLYVGRLIHLKGLDRLFRALAALKEPPDWRLILVGSGPERVRLQALARALGISDRLRWQPAVPAHQVAAFYQEADILLQPSRGDGWGMTIPEALRHGCEVVAAEACGAADLARPEYRLPADETAWPTILTQALQAGPLTAVQRQSNQTRARAYSAEAGVARLREVLGS